MSDSVSDALPIIDFSPFNAKKIEIFNRIPRDYRGLIGAIRKNPDRLDGAYSAISRDEMVYLCNGTGWNDCTQIWQYCLDEKKTEVLVTTAKGFQLDQLELFESYLAKLLTPEELMERFL